MKVEESQKLKDAAIYSIKKLDDMNLSEQAYDEIYRLLKIMKLFGFEEGKREGARMNKLFSL